MQTAPVEPARTSQYVVEYSKGMADAVTNMRLNAYSDKDVMDRLKEATNVKATRFFAYLKVKETTGRLVFSSEVGKATAKFPGMDKDVHYVALTIRKPEDNNVIRMGLKDKSVTAALNSIASWCSKEDVEDVNYYELYEVDKDIPGLQRLIEYKRVVSGVEKPKYVPPARTSADDYSPPPRQMVPLTPTSSVPVRQSTTVVERPPRTEKKVSRSIYIRPKRKYYVQPSK